MSTARRNVKINTPGIEPARTTESVVVPEPETSTPDTVIDATPTGLPSPDDIDPSTLRRPVLTTEGWICPTDIRGGGR